MDEALDALELTQDAYEHRFERHTRIVGYYVLTAMYEIGNDSDIGTPEGIDAMIDCAMRTWRRCGWQGHGWMNVPLVEIDISEDTIRYMILLQSILARVDKSFSRLFETVMYRPSTRKVDNMLSLC